MAVTFPKGDKVNDKRKVEDSDFDSPGPLEHSVCEHPRVAIGLDNGRVIIYDIFDTDKFIYVKSLPWFKGRVLSVTWSTDAYYLYSGSSDGLIRCWNAALGSEIYRITAGLGGLGSGHELCNGLGHLLVRTVVVASSFGQHGTLLQAHSYHKEHANALAAAPSHDRVFSTSSDGKVILYKLSGNQLASSDDINSPSTMKKWIYIDYKRVHTHDIKALIVVASISVVPHEDIKPENRNKRARCEEKPIDFSYHKWAHLGVPLLISAGDDTQLFAHAVNEFTRFSPHDICPAPQRPPIQLVLNSVFDQSKILLVQSSHWIDVHLLQLKNVRIPGGFTKIEAVARVKSKASRKIICSTISNSGVLFAYSDHKKPSLWELKRFDDRNITWDVDKRKLPQRLPYAHSMIFTHDSS